MTNHPDPDSDNTQPLGESNSKNDSPNLADAPSLLPATQEAAGHPEADTLPPSSASAGYSAAEDATLPGAAMGQAPLAASTTQSVKYFGDYELLSEIARGGMGVVYKARQVNLNRLVALKMILAGQLASDEDVKRFYTEAEAAAALEHPGIVPIFEIGQHNDQHFFSMGFVDGGSLADKIKDGPLPSKEAAAYTKKVAEAIAYAHSKGVIHRDLKPANILLDRSGEPKVTDFGLARRTESNSDLTRTGAVMGTPSYMPPEQAAGRTDQVGPLADVYSLGAILYCLLTGRPPFQASNPLDTLMQVMEREPVSVSTLNPATHRDLETICHKCLQKDPAKRYASAQEFADDLGRWLSGEPIRARAVSSSERAWRWVKRHRTVSALIVATTAAVLIGSAVSVLFGFAATREATRARMAEEIAVAKESEAKEAELTALSAKDDLAQEKQKSDRKLYARTVSLAYQQWLESNIDRCQNLLDSTAIPFRDWEWNFVKRLCNTEYRTLQGHIGIPYRMQTTADGKYLVSLGNPSTVIKDSNIYLWNLAEGFLLKRIPYKGLAISADGKYVAMAVKENGPVAIINVLTEELLFKVAPHLGGTEFADFSSDGSQLVTTGQDKTIRVWSMLSGEKTREILQEGRSMVRPVSFCDNDRSLVFRTDDETIQVFDIASEKIIKEIPDSGSNTPSEKLLVSPDGRMLASASGNLIRLFDFASGSLLGTLRGHEGTVLSIAFHPNALRLVSSGKDGTVRVWDSKEFREVTRFRGHKAGMVFGVFDVIYSKDGKWIISGGADRSIKIWPHDAGDGSELLEQDAPAVPDPSQEKDWLVGSRDFIHDVDFSEDGRWVASAGKDGKCRVYDHATRELIYTFDRHQQSVGAIAFHPNGDWIASGEGGWEASQAGKIFIWKRTNGEVLRTFDGHTGPISSLHFSPDGQRLYSSVGNERFLQPGEIIAWDFASSSVRWKNSLDSGVSDMALSRDGKQLAAVVTVPQQPLKGKISLYDTELGAFEKEIDGDRSFYTSIDFSPNGRQLVAGARTSDISLIDIESGERIWKHSEHSGAVTDVAFHPSGKRIASASIDRSGKLWDAESGDVLLDFSRDVFELVGIEFSPSGQTLAYFGTFPYVSLRDAPQSTTLESPDLAWPIVFQDDFERGELGERWTVVNGRWDIEDGAAQGTLVSMLPGIAETHMIPKDWIPSTVAIELDAWAPQKLSIAINLTTPPGTKPQSAIGSVFLWQGKGMFNGGETGASIFSSGPHFQELSKTGKRLNWFEPGRKYRLKSIRQGERWQAFIDGIPVLESLIPADMSLPSLMLQAFSDVGATLYIDNLVVRAPRDVPDEIAAKSFVKDLQKDLKIRALVLNAIASKQDINEETRRIATRFAWAEVENMATRKQIIRTELSRGDRSEGFFLQVAKVLEADSRLDDNDWEVQQLLAIAYYRALQYQQAKDAATAADATHRKLFGMSHPVSIAILSLSESKLDNEPAALHHQGDLRDLMRSRYWAADDSAREWSALAYENVLPSPRDEQRARDEEEIRRITFEPQQEALCDQVYEGYFSTFTEDAVQIDGRSLEPSPYDVEFPIERWKNAQRVFGRSAPPLNARFVRSHADVEIVGDDAILRGTYTFSIPRGYWRWQSDERLKKTAQGWKIYHRRHGMTGIRFGENQEIDEDTDWSVRDAAVETAREQSNDSNLLDQLVRAWHLRDAFESVKPLTNNTQAQAGLWNRLADRAYSMADADEMLRAGRKAVELDPKIQGLPFLRALAFERYLPSEATDLGHGISVQTPTFMTQPSRLDFSVPGRVLAGWYPSDRSALLVFHAADAFEEGDTLEGETRSLAELFQKTFLATIHRQRMTVIDGSAAGDVIVEGDGNGRTLVAAGQGNNIGTVQRWITVQRDKEGIGLLLTAPTDEFDQRNTEFEEWLKRVKIQKQSPTTE